MLWLVANEDHGHFFPVLEEAQMRVYRDAGRAIQGPFIPADELRKVTAERDRYEAALKRMKTHPVLTAGFDPLKAAGLRIVNEALRGWR